MSPPPSPATIVILEWPAFQEKPEEDSGYDDDESMYGPDNVDQEAHAFEERWFSGKGYKKSGGSSGGVERRATKQMRHRGKRLVKACDARKLELRTEEAMAQLTARKENKVRRRGAAVPLRASSSYRRGRPKKKPKQHLQRRFGGGGGGGGGGGSGFQDATGALLSAEELGLESGYERLLQIMNGAEITPEDFDML